MVSGNAFAEFSAAQAQTAVNAVRAFFFDVSALLPNEIVLTTSPVVDQYDIASGQLVGSVSAATPPASVGGTSTATFWMAAGVKVNLNTTNIRNGRRVRGGIYLVPSGSGVMNDSGTVSSAVRTTVNTAGGRLISALGASGIQLAVYSRPLGGDEPRGPRAGGISVVSAIETNEKGAVLRGRRD